MRTCLQLMLSLRRESAVALRTCLSFSGSGHLLAYHLGVARHLVPKLQPAAVAGSSGGAIVAAAVSILPQGEIEDFAEEVLASRDGFRTLVRRLEMAQPPADDLLFVCATKCRTGQAVLLSRFSDRERLRQCVVASCAIPPSAHPFDLVRTSTYPEREGVIVHPSCHPDHADDRLPYSPHGDAFVDGGLSAAAPLVPGFRNVTISPISGPQGRFSDRHFHLCPIDTSPRFPFAPRLAGMRCYLSIANLQALPASVAISPSLMRDWYDRGGADAQRFLDAPEAARLASPSR